MADIVVSIASKVAEYLVAPVGRQCGYVIFSTSYVGRLKDQVEKLEDARVAVQRSVDYAQNDMKEIKPAVLRWMTKADSVANKARGVLDNVERAKKTCFCGWLPNPKERYCLGRDARKTVQAIQELILQGQFGRVDYDPPPPGHVAGAPDVNSSAGDGYDTITESRASIFQGLMKALDDEKLKVIGVYGPGGVGKTTLLEEVEKKLRKEGRPFHTIVKAKVSQTPYLRKIQDDIAYAFGLKLKDEPSEEGRRDLLFRKIQSDPTKKVLIILDDLWDKLDLKAVGIPSRDESTGCKLLLSSRYKDVLEQKMHADQTFCLEGLKGNEAFMLFEKTVGDRLKDDEELKPIAAQVVNKLAGLPLLIISVASTLKYSDAPAWRNALIKIEESNIETIVKLAYDHLKKEDAKSLFLLCGLISGTIRVEILLVLGMGLGLFEGFNKTMEDARDRLDNMLSELRSACLLLDGGDDKGNVTIHDLYSEVVVSTPFRGQNSLIMNNNSWSKEKLEKCWAICLTDVGSDRLAEVMRCGFPDLKILMLSQAEDWRGRPAHRHVGDCCRLDFTYMKQLRVLYIRFMHIPNLPSSIEILENLRSLYLDRCVVKDVAILGKLKALQILSFAGSEISKLPKEIGDLTNLKSLNLSNCDSLEIIEPGVLKGLINLEELLMQGSFNRWMGNDEVPSESCNAKLAELKSLTKLSALEISIRDPTILLEDDYLPVGNLIRFWIVIGRGVYGGEFGGLRTMKIKLGGCDGVLSKEWIQKTLYKTQHLHLDGLREFKKSAHELCTQGFPQLKHLDIYNSPSIAYIANSSNGLPPTAFTKLESLFLGNLINLEKIWNGPVAPDCFSKLKVVRIVKCRRLKNLWFLSEMQRLVHLEEIIVRECDSLQAIIIDDGGIVEVAADHRVVLPNVRLLDLRYLPNMTSFCTGAEGAPIQMKEVVTKEEGSRSKGVVMSLPSLTDIIIRGCRNFEAFNSSPTSVDEKLDETAEENDESPQPLFNEMVKLPKIRSLQIEGAQCKELWNNRIPDDSFCKLEFLRLKHCDNLQRVAPSHMWKRLHCSLDILQVESCRSIKIIYEGDDTVMKSGKLRRLVLRDLENLRHIWQSDGLPNVPFPSLKFIGVQSCTRLRVLFPTFTPKFLGQIKELVVESCEVMELIASHEECEEATGTAITFSELSALRLFELPKFKSFLPEKYSEEFPSLQVLSRVSCGTEPDQCLDDWKSYQRRIDLEIYRETVKYSWQPTRI